MKQYSLSFLIISALLFQIAYSDLPVHCNHEQIVGKWKLELEEPQIIGHGMLNCGHDMPDSPLTSYKAGMDTFQSEQIVNVELHKDNSVTHLYKKQKTGHWTMVYDEGFELEHNHITYFAFSKYKKVKNQYKSVCGQTLVGWYNNKKTAERGCYKAIKYSQDNSKESEAADNAHVVQPKLLELEPQKLTMDHQEEIVAMINKMKDVSWQAKTYDMWTGFTLEELNRKIGRKRFFQDVLPSSMIQENQDDDDNDDDDDEDDPYKNFSLEDLSDFPKSFSWEPIRFLPPVREQKDCGSCYAISTMAMLSARLRIKGISEDIDLAPQYSVDCNYYNQGCEGGYPYLVEKFVSESFAISEELYPYSGYDQKCNQEAIKKAKQVYGVKSYKYIGGSYGKSSEKKIMQEIFDNGPVVVNFEPLFDFMFYSGGIYHSTPAADWILDHKEKPLWEKVDHSVLCYGWGEEKGEKYWLLQNSWGEGWGENGRFRMRRGVDESNVESMGEAADPYQVRQKKQQPKTQQKNLRK